MTGPERCRELALERGWIPDPVDPDLFFTVHPSGSHTAVLRDLAWYHVPALEEAR